MTDLTVKHFNDLEYYQGEHAVPGIRFRYAGKALGVTAWGMNVIDIDPNCQLYPEHDHTADGQEELYTLLKGAAVLQVAGATHALEPGVLVRVGPKTKRKIVTQTEGAVVLAIGATPG